MVFHHVNCKADKFTAGARQSLCLELTSNCLHSHLRDAHLCRVHSLSVVCFIMKSLPRSGGKYLLRHVLVFCSSNAFFFLLFVSVLLTRCISALVRLWCFFFYFFGSLLSPRENFHEVLERNMLSSSYPTTFSLFRRKCFICIVG